MIKNKKWSWSWAWPKYDHTVYFDTYRPIWPVFLAFVVIVSPEALGRWAGHVVLAYKGLVP